MGMEGMNKSISDGSSHSIGSEGIIENNVEDETKDDTESHKEDEYEDRDEREAELEIEVHKKDKEEAVHLGQRRFWSYDYENVLGDYDGLLNSFKEEYYCYENFEE